MDFAQVIRTTFAAREFTGEAVPDEVLHHILDHARFAPSGGNRQGWRVIVVRDRAARRRLAEICKPAWRRYRAQRAAGENPWNTVVPSRVNDAQVAAESDAHPTLDALHDPTKVPLVLVVAVDLAVVASMDKELDRVGVISGASIYPFVWSLLLAARNEGLGGTLMTFLAAGEPEVKSLLGIPERYAVAAMIPLGRPVKQLSKLTRKPVEQFATLDRFDGEPVRGPARAADAAR
jgi:nitroreductase